MHFIKAERSAHLVADIAEALKETRRGCAHAGHGLNRLEEDRRQARVGGRAAGGQIAPGDAGDFQGSCGEGLQRDIADGAGGGGAAVEGALEGNHPLPSGGGQSHFEGVLVGFGTAVG